MENLKCPQCGKPMVEVDLTGYYTKGHEAYPYRYKAMQCVEHTTESYLSDKQVSDTLYKIDEIKGFVQLLKAEASK